MPGETVAQRQSQLEREKFNCLAGSDDYNKKQYQQSWLQFSSISQVSQVKQKVGAHLQQQEQENKKEREKLERDTQSLTSMVQGERESLIVSTQEISEQFLVDLCDSFTQEKDPRAVERSLLTWEEMLGTQIPQVSAQDLLNKQNWAENIQQHLPQLQQDLLVVRKAVNDSTQANQFNWQFLQDKLRPKTQNQAQAELNRALDAALEAVQKLQSSSPVPPMQALKAYYDLLVAYQELQAVMYKMDGQPVLGQQQQPQRTLVHQAIATLAACLDQTTPTLQEALQHQQDLNIKPPKPPKLPARQLFLDIGQTQQEVMQRELDRQHQVLLQNAPALLAEITNAYQQANQQAKLAQYQQELQRAIEQKNYYEAQAICQNIRALDPAAQLPLKELDRLEIQLKDINCLQEDYDHLTSGKLRIGVVGNLSEGNINLAKTQAREREALRERKENEMVQVLRTKSIPASRGDIEDLKEEYQQLVQNNPQQPVTAEQFREDLERHERAPTAQIGSLYDLKELAAFKTQQEKAQQAAQQAAQAAQAAVQQVAQKQKTQNILNDDKKAKLVELDAYQKIASALQQMDRAIEQNQNQNQNQQLNLDQNASDQLRGYVDQAIFDLEALQVKDQQQQQQQQQQQPFPLANALASLKAVQQKINLYDHQGQLIMPIITAAVAPLIRDHLQIASNNFQQNPQEIIEAQQIALEAIALEMQKPEYQAQDQSQQLQKLKHQEQVLQQAAAAEQKLAIWQQLPSAHQQQFIAHQRDLNHPHEALRTFYQRREEECSLEKNESKMMQMRNQVKSLEADKLSADPLSQSGDIMQTQVLYWQNGPLGPGGKIKSLASSYDFQQLVCPSCTPQQAKTLRQPFVQKLKEIDKENERAILFDYEVTAAKKDPFDDSYQIENEQQQLLQYTDYKSFMAQPSEHSVSSLNPQCLATLCPLGTNVKDQKGLFKGIPGDEEYAINPAATEEGIFSKHPALQRRFEDLAKQDERIVLQRQMEIHMLKEWRDKIVRRITEQQTQIKEGLHVSPAEISDLQAEITEFQNAYQAFKFNCLLLTHQIGNESIKEKLQKPIEELHQASFTRYFERMKQELLQQQKDEMIRQLGLKKPIDAELEKDLNNAVLESQRRTEVRMLEQIYAENESFRTYLRSHRYDIQFHKGPEIKVQIFLGEDNEAQLKRENEQAVFKIKYTTTSKGDVKLESTDAGAIREIAKAIANPAEGSDTGKCHEVTGTPGQLLVFLQELLGDGKKTTKVDFSDMQFNLTYIMEDETKGSKVPLNTKPAKGLNKLYQVLTSDQFYGGTLWNSSKLAECQKKPHEAIIKLLEKYALLASQQDDSLLSSSSDSSGVHKGASQQQAGVGGQRQVHIGPNPNP